MEIVFKTLILMTIPSAVFLGPRRPRLSLAAEVPSYYYTNINNVPGTYSFGYDVFDQQFGNTQFRNEERFPNGTVVGSYGYMDALGRARRFDYVADEKGYRVKNFEPSKEDYVELNKKASNPSTESSITWTRGNKKKKNNENKHFNRRKFNTFQPLSSYLLY